MVFLCVSVVPFARWEGSSVIFSYRLVVRIKCFDPNECLSNAWHSVNQASMILLLVIRAALSEEAVVVAMTRLIVTQSEP